MRAVTSFLARHRYALSYLILALALLGGVFRVEGLAHQGQQAHRALCSFKEDLARRVEDGQDFLRTHPDGVLGISAKEIQRSLNSQRATLDSLSDLKCP